MRSRECDPSEDNPFYPRPIPARKLKERKSVVTTCLQTLKYQIKDAFSELAAAVSLPKSRKASDYHQGLTAKELNFAVYSEILVLAAHHGLTLGNQTLITNLATQGQQAVQQ